MAARPVGGLPSQGLGCRSASGVDSAEWHVQPGVLRGEVQVTVVGDQHSSVDLAGVEVD